MYSSSLKTFDTYTFMDLYPIQCGKACCPPSHQYGPTSTINYLFHIIIEGKGQFNNINTKKTYTIEKGKGYLILPNTLTSYQADYDDPWVYYWLEVNGHKASKLFEQAGINQQNPIFEIDNLDSIDSIFEPIDFLIENKTDNDSMILSQCFRFFALLQEHSTLYRQKKYPSAKLLYVQQAIFYIKQNFKHSITLNQVAQFVNISPQYLTKLFRQELSTSVSDFIIDTRMSEAMHLLKETNLTIHEISEKVGYKNQFYFSIAFKKRFQLSPSEFRKNESIKAKIL